MKKVIFIGNGDMYRSKLWTMRQYAGFSTANDIALAMKKVYSKTNLEYDIHISPINDEGIKIIEVK